MNFEKSIFINCPFDKDYRPLLEAMLFTIIYLNYEPLISETKDGGKERLNSIQNLIQSAKFSIHDISRIEVSTVTSLPRFNMPFELGIDFGCRNYGDEMMKTKMFLILDKEKYRYHISLSDIGGKDIEYHNNEAKTLVRQVRNWLIKVQNIKLIAPNKVWQEYNEFIKDFEVILEGEGFDSDDIEEFPTSELIRYMKDWISARIV